VDQGLLKTCLRPKAEIEELLARDELLMSGLIRQRVQILHDLGARAKQVPIQPQL
jgi:hypothetical protein